MVALYQLFVLKWFFLSMAGIKFHDQVNVSRRKKSNLIFPLTQCWEVRSYRCCNTWCQFVCLLLQRPGVVFPKFEREKKKKKKHALRKAKTEMWAAANCSNWQVPSRYWQVARRRSCPPPRPGAPGASITCGAGTGEVEGLSFPWAG